MSKCAHSTHTIAICKWAGPHIILRQSWRFKYFTRICATKIWSSMVHVCVCVILWTTVVKFTFLFRLLKLSVWTSIALNGIWPFAHIVVHSGHTIHTIHWVGRCLVKYYVDHSNSCLTVLSKQTISSERPLYRLLPLCMWNQTLTLVWVNKPWRRPDMSQLVIQAKTM